MASFQKISIILFLWLIGISLIDHSLAQRQARSCVMASWYGPGFHGRPTASGEVFNQHAYTAAHKTLPFGTKIRATNPHTGESIVVRINDRGPYISGRELDLSKAAARRIGVQGVDCIQIKILDKG